MEVSSPTSVPVWIPKLPQLKQLDELLRCGICYEFLRTSVVTSCSHNYCSLCIRQYLNYKNSCPTCYADTSDSELRPNRTLDSVVDYFPAIRDALIQYFKQGAGSPEPKYTTSSSSNSQSRGKIKNDNIDQNVSRFDNFRVNFSSSVPVLKVNSPQKTPAKCGTSNTALVRPSSRFVSCDDVVCLGSPSSAGVTPNRTPTKKTAVKGLLAALDSTEPDFLVKPSPVKRTNFLDYFSPKKSHSSAVGGISASQGGGGTSIDGQSESSANSAATAARPAPIAVAKPSIGSCANGSSTNTVLCPVCSVSVPALSINRHLDACAERDTAAAAKPAPRRRVLPKLVYHLLKDSVLRDKVKKAGLSTAGSREALIKRHKIYVSLYNSECDKESPRPVKELLRQVEREENGLQLQSRASPSVFQYDSKSAPEVIEKEQEKILKKYNNQFSTLLADVERRRNIGKGRSPTKSSKSPSSSSRSMDRPPNPSNKVLSLVNLEAESDSNDDFESGTLRPAAGNSRAPSSILSPAASLKAAGRTCFQLSSSYADDTPRRSKLSKQRDTGKRVGDDTHPERSSQAVDAMDKDGARWNTAAVELDLDALEKGPTKRDSASGRLQCDGKRTERLECDDKKTEKPQLDKRKRTILENVAAENSSLSKNGPPETNNSGKENDSIFEGYDDDDELLFNTVSVKEEELTANKQSQDLCPMFMPYKTTQLIAKQSPRSASGSSHDFQSCRQSSILRHSCRKEASEGRPISVQDAASDEESDDFATQVFPLDDEMLAEYSSPVMNMTCKITSPVKSGPNVNYGYETGNRTDPDVSPTRKNHSIPTSASRIHSKESKPKKGASNASVVAGAEKSLSEPTSATACLTSQGDESPDPFACSDNEDGDSNCSFSLMDDRAAHLQEIGITENLTEAIQPRNQMNQVEETEEETEEEDIIPVSQKRLSDPVCTKSRLNYPTDLPALSSLNGVCNNEFSEPISRTGRESTLRGGKEGESLDVSEVEELHLFRSAGRTIPNRIESQLLESEEIVYSEKSCDSEELHLNRGRPGQRRNTRLDSLEEGENMGFPSEGSCSKPFYLDFHHRSRSRCQKKTRTREDKSRSTTPDSLSGDGAPPGVKVHPRRNCRNVYANSNGAVALVTSNEAALSRPADAGPSSGGYKCAAANRECVVVLRRSVRRPHSHAPDSHEASMIAACGPGTLEMAEPSESDADYLPSPQDMLLSDSSLDAVSLPPSRKRKSSVLLEPSLTVEAGVEAKRRSTRRRRN